MVYVCVSTETDSEINPARFAKTIALKSVSSKLILVINSEVKAAIPKPHRGSLMRAVYPNFHGVVGRCYRSFFFPARHSALVFSSVK